MNRKQVSALLVLKELGIGHRMGTFTDRLKVQKSVYLAQAAGVDIGHHFNWYLRGPYAPGLTQDVFDAIENEDVDSILDEWELDAASKRKLTALKKSFRPPKDLEEPQWLELLASAHFLVARDQVAKPDAPTLTEQLRKYRKNFTRSQVGAALTKLRKLRLIGSPAH